MLVVLLGMIGIIGPYGTVSLAGGHVTRRERNVAATAEWAAEVELQPELAIKNCVPVSTRIDELKKMPYKEKFDLLYRRLRDDYWLGKRHQLRSAYSKYYEELHQIEDRIAHVPIAPGSWDERRQQLLSRMDWIEVDMEMMERIHQILTEGFGGHECKILKVLLFRKMKDIILSWENEQYENYTKAVQRRMTSGDLNFATVAPPQYREQREIPDEVALNWYIVTRELLGDAGNLDVYTIGGTAALPSHETQYALVKYETNYEQPSAAMAYVPVRNQEGTYGDLSAWRHDQQLRGELRGACLFCKGGAYEEAEEQSHMDVD